MNTEALSISRLVLSYHAENNVVGASFGWQCCRRHHNWLQAGTVDYKAHRSMAVTCKRDKNMKCSHAMRQDVFNLPVRSDKFDLKCPSSQTCGFLLVPPVEYLSFSVWNDV